nr:hypothetical protein [uncultured Brevundimonas sp.]
MIARTLCLAVLLAGLAPADGRAQSREPNPELGADTAAAAAPFETLELSARLARLGTERADPWLLATAARLRLSTPVPFGSGRVEQSQAENGAGDESDAGGTRPQTWPDTAIAWLNEAEALADGDPQVLAFIQSIRAMDYKGRQAGPLVSLARLPGGQTHVFRERFTPGRPAVVYVEGDGDAPLAVTVRSGKGLICQASGPGDVKLCTWTAREPGDYRVEVRNLGAAANRYAYGTN